MGRCALQGNGLVLVPIRTNELYDLAKPKLLETHLLIKFQRLSYHDALDGLEIVIALDS
jgi:hypothetical protein